MRRAVVLIVALSVVATLAVVLVKGTSGGTRIAGTNDVEAGSFSVVLRDGQRHCQVPNLVPEDVDRMRMTIGSYGKPTPPIDLVIATRDGERVVERRVPGGYSEGVATLPLGTTTREELDGAAVCITPRGTKIALGGFGELARIEWLRDGSPSYLGTFGDIARRFGYGGPGWHGAWTIFLLALVLIAVWVVAVRLVLREATRS